MLPLSLIMTSLRFVLPLIALSLAGCPASSDNRPAPAGPPAPSYSWTPAGRLQRVIDTFGTEDIGMIDGRHVSTLWDRTHHYVVRAKDGSVWYVYVDGMSRIERRERLIAPLVRTSETTPSEVIK